MYSSPLFGLIVAKKDAANSSPDVTSGSLGGESRFGFIVSKKISKKAVVRNRIRRLLSEAVQNLLSRMKQGFEGVFLAKREIAGKSYDEVFDEVERVLEEAKMVEVEK